MLSNLKIKLAIIIFVLVCIGMIAIAAVGYGFLVHSIRKIEIANLSENLDFFAKEKLDGGDCSSFQTLEETAYLNRYGVDCYAIIANSKLCESGSKCFEADEHEGLLAEVLQSNKARVILKGGVIERLRYGQTFIAALPFTTIGRSSNALLLKGKLNTSWYIYDNLFEIILVYILVNGIVITIIGFFRVVKIVCRPLENLVELADSYTSGTLDEQWKNSDKNEFGQLGFRLKQLIRKIEDDNIALKSTVESLSHSNKELERAREEIVRAEKLASVGRLSAGLAHEVGNPLAIVKGYLEIIENDDISKDEAREFLKRAEKEILRIESIISQLLDFSRNSKKVPAEVNLIDMFNDLISVFNSRALYKNISFESKFFDEKVVVRADYDSLRQVFLNCVLNSIDAISENAEITSGEIKIEISMLAGSTEGRNASIKIADNGIGINEENLLNVFDPFFTTKDPGRGTGLGLAVSYSIVEQYGGTISFEKDRKEGACLCIQMPCVIEEI